MDRALLWKLAIGLPIPGKALLSLPEVDVPSRVEFGRVAHDGYQRGWSLKFNDLGVAVSRDPLFRKAFARARRHTDTRTVVSTERLMNLFLLIRFYMGKLARQDIIEFGSYRGGSAIFMATVLQETHPDARVFALDTYAGMPTTGDIDMHKKGNFDDSRLPAIRDAAKRFGLNNIEFVQGLVQETTQAVAERGGPFGLAHIDLDIYSAIRYSQDAIWPHLVSGAYLVYDDATESSCIGATQAVEEFIRERHIGSEQIWPHFVFRAHLNT